MSWHPEYSVHPAIAYSRSVIASMPERTGRSMEEWVQLALREGPASEKECRDWLRASHALGGTTAAGIASFAHGEGRLQVDEGHYLRSAPVLVDTMYSGKKAHLRPIHDAAVRAVLEACEEVRIAPTKTTVPFYREHVFAHLKPATQSRVDLGLSIRHQSPPDDPRLVNTGGAAKKDRITWRIPLTSVEQVDGLVRLCVRTAYQEDVPR